MQGGSGASSGDAVRAQKDMSSNVQDRFREARKNPEKELGLPLEELQRRQFEARKPHAFVSDGTKRKFEVKSSARAQQIMNEGIDKFQREKRQKDLKKNLTMLRKVQVVLCFFTAGLFGWLAVSYLLPQYAAVQTRNRRMQVRFDRAQQSLAGVSGGEKVADAPAGPVVRVFRVESESGEAPKRTIL